MPFGRHKGKDLTEIPRGYLRWALKNCSHLDPELRTDMEAVVRGEPIPKSMDERINEIIGQGAWSPYCSPELNFTT
jgi:hypothetical protein